VALTQSFDSVADEPASRLRPRIATLIAAFTTEWVFFAVFVAGLTWVPFWLGIDRLIAWGINAFLFPGLAAFYELSLILRRASHPVAFQRVRLAGVLFGLAAAWALLQNATWVPVGWQHPIWQLASDVLGRPIAGSISIDRSLTAIALLRLITAASVFWLALQLSRDGTRARWLLWSVVAIGAVYAAVGIFALGFAPNGRVFAELVRAKVVTSTFVNQNHYVTSRRNPGSWRRLGSSCSLYRRRSLTDIFCG
jgi:hypothetical protein